MKLPFDARTALAFGITVAAVFGITILSLVVIATTDPDVNDRAQNIFNAVLPLFGTWVGTVLAYYFSRENFMAASDSTQQLVGALDERLRSTRVSDVMIKTIFSRNDLNAKAEEVLEELADKNFKRVLILQPSGALEALLYLEDVLSYLYEFPKADRSKKHWATYSRKSRI